MVGVKIGSVHVDLAKTVSDYECGSSSGTKHDTRSVLYSVDTLSNHRYVSVQVPSASDQPSFAEVRRSAGSASWVSMSLMQALGYENYQVESPTDMELDVFDVEASDGSKSPCVCALGTIDRVTISFLSRTRPPRAVISSLQLSIHKILLREVIWDRRRMQVSWFLRPEVIEFTRVGVSNTGSGCCSALGIISSTAVIDLVFSDDEDKFSQSCAQFKSVEVLVTEIERELGGVSVYAARVVSAIIERLSNTHASSSVGAILTGLPGIGKTALAKAICGVIHVPVRHLNGADVFQTLVGQSEAHIVRVFEELAQHSPCILIIDGLESVATSRDRFLESDSALEVGVLGTFLASLDKLKHYSAPVFVLGTTSRINDIDTAAYSNGRMDLLVRMEPPALKQRHEILCRMMSSWTVDSDLIAKLSDSTGGYVAADLLSLCQKALQACLNKTSATSVPVVTHKHFKEALQTTFPSVLQAHHVSLRSQPLAEARSRSDAFDGIYGVDDALKTIKVSLLEPLRDCSRFFRFGTLPPKGILLTGPPGSGKTHLANVIGTELRRQGLASFVSVRCTDLLTKVVGDTEKTLREMFETARSAAPCVIYFDQIESIAPVRGFDTSTEQTFDRLLSMLLVEMDGFSTSREALQESMNSDQARDTFLKHHVVILASTSRKDSLDPAILRPGRFDVHIELDLPNRVAREHIVMDALAPIPIDYTSDEELCSLEKLAAFVAEHTEQFTAGDLTSLLREAAMASLREDFEKPSISVRFVREALRQQLIRNQR